MVIWPQVVGHPTKATWRRQTLVAEQPVMCDGRPPNGNFGQISASVLGSTLGSGPTNTRNYLQSRLEPLALQVMDSSTTLPFRLWLTQGHCI